MTTITRYSLIGALVVAILLGAYGVLLSQRLETAKLQVREQQKSLAQQAGLIATLQVQDAQNRALMAAQQQREQQLRQQATDNERKFRDAIKNDECAARNMPGAVIELLQPAGTTAGTATTNPASP